MYGVLDSNPYWLAITSWAIDPPNARLVLRWPGTSAGVRAFTWHQLSVHVVANHGADRHMLAREAHWRNTLEQAGVAFEVASDECAWYAWQVMHTQT